MKRVFSSGDRILVGLRQSVLESADIPCEVLSRYGILDYFHSDCPISLAPLELCVRDADYDEAVALLDAATQKEA
jgi:hypothetical protein